MRILFAAAAVLLLAVTAVSAETDMIKLLNDQFEINISEAGGGISTLKRRNDVYNTNYVVKDKIIGDVSLRFRTSDTGPWVECSTANSKDARVIEPVSGNIVKVSYPNDSSDPKGIKSVSLEETYQLDKGNLIWSIKLKNKASEKIEIGDIGLPLPFNNKYGDAEGTSKYIFERCIVRHSFISGDGSFIFVERVNGVGPYLLMTPNPGTHLEYFAQRKEPYTVYIHAKARAIDIDKEGTWRLPISSRILKPGEDITYSFKFQWVKDYDAVRKALVKDGSVSVQAVPGMVVPGAMEAKFSLATTQPIQSLTPEFPNDTKIEYLGKKPGNNHVYRVWFNKLGENMITVNYGKNQKLYLEYFSTQPLDAVIEKRASFIVRKQQVRDASKWYDGLFSVWDMEHKTLRTPDDNGGLRDYMVGGSDDPTNCKAPYVALKNVSYPCQSEIDALEHYASKFLWGGMQRKDTENPYPYGIYGIDNWYLNRNSQNGFGSGTGQEHLWRSYDYPAIFYFYLQMYKIAKLYPDKVKYLDAAGYLDRAYHTARAMFEVAYGVKTYKGEYTDYTYKMGIYNELCIPEMIDILRTEGRPADAECLRNEWEKKVKYFVYDEPYPFSSEYAFDTTGYESTHAIAKYGLSHEIKPDHNLWQDKNSGQWYSHPKVSRKDFEVFMEKQTEANIANRGWLEASYYHLGSDIRYSNAGYQLSYMTQMGGWSILDYALYYAKNPTQYLRLGYASSLGSWALVNCGNQESNYGYWYPGQDNDGAAGWGFEPQKIARPWDGVPQGRGPWTYDGEIDHGFIGGLRCARTVVIDDPIFGLFAYGGTLIQSKDMISVIPQDGLNQRFHLLNTKPKLNMQINRDGFSRIEVYFTPKKAVQKICLNMGNRTGDTHITELSLDGLPAGEYSLAVGAETQKCDIVGGNNTLRIKAPKDDSYIVTIEEERR